MWDGMIFFFALIPRMGTDGGVLGVLFPRLVEGCVIFSFFFLCTVDCMLDIYHGRRRRRRPIDLRRFDGQLPLRSAHELRSEASRARDARYIDQTRMLLT